MSPPGSKYSVEDNRAPSPRFAAGALARAERPVALRITCTHTLHVATCRCPGRCSLPLSLTLSSGTDHCPCSLSLSSGVAPPAIRARRRDPLGRLDTARSGSDGAARPARCELTLTHREAVAEPHHESWFARLVTEGGIKVHNTVTVRIEKERVEVILFEHTRDDGPGLVRVFDINHHALTIQVDRRTVRTLCGGGNGPGPTLCVASAGETTGRSSCCLDRSPSSALLIVGPNNITTQGTETRNRNVRDRVVMDSPIVIEA